MGTAQHQQGRSGGAGQHYGGQQQGGRRGSEEDVVNNKPFKQWANDFQKWIRVEILKETISFAEDMGKLLKSDGLTTSQIRNIFGEMRKIQLNGFEKEKSNFLLLRAKLAYAAKRQNAKGLEKFYEMFCWGYEAVDTNNVNEGKVQFDRFLQVMEAVLAYHKFHGGQ